MAKTSKLNFKKTTTETKSEKPENQLYINLGFEVEIDGNPEFVNLPLSLTADQIDKAIESVQNRINAKTPSNLVEIYEGKIAIAEAVKALFSAMSEGQTLLTTEIDPEDEDFGFLANMQIQFNKIEPKEQVDTSDSKANIRSKLFAKK